MMDHGFFDGPWRGGMRTGSDGLRLLWEVAKRKRRERDASPPPPEAPQDRGEKDQAR